MLDRKRRPPSPTRFAPTGAGRGALCLPNSPKAEQWARDYMGTSVSFADALARVRAWSRELALHG